MLESGEYPERGTVNWRGDIIGNTISASLPTGGNLSSLQNKNSGDLLELHEPLATFALDFGPSGGTPWDHILATTRALHTRR